MERDRAAVPAAGGYPVGCRSSSAITRPARGRPSSERIEEKARIARRLHKYRIDPKSIEDGTLVPFGADPLRANQTERPTGRSFFDSFEHAGERYLIDDLYCPNPECHCDAGPSGCSSTCRPASPGAARLPRTVFWPGCPLTGGLEDRNVTAVRRARPRPFCQPGENSMAATSKNYGGAVKRSRRSPGAASRRRTVVLRRDDLLPEKPAAAGVPHRTE